MATALIQGQPSKAEELERLSETSLAFVKEALSLEENGLESSVSCPMYLLSFFLFICSNFLVFMGTPGFYIFYPTFHVYIVVEQLVLQTIYVLKKEILKFLGIKSAIESGLSIYIMPRILTVHTSL